MSLATPIRGKPLSSSDMINESPLPTPPQAMHDLLRNGKVAAAAAAAAASAAASRSSLGGHSIEDAKRVATSSSYRHSSSPSARAANGMVDRSTGRIAGSSKSPSSSSLAASMGATSSTNHYQQRSALGSQMGILQNGIGTEVVPLKPTRPGALKSNSQRSSSYEVSPKQTSEEIPKINARPGLMSLAASASSHGLNGRGNNKENIEKDLRGHQRCISAAKRYSYRRSPSPTSTSMVAESAYNHDTNIYRRSPPDNDKKQLLSMSARRMLKKSSEDMAALSRRRSAEGDENLSPKRETSVKDEKTVDEGLGVASTSQFVTPGFNSNGRVLRSGQPPKHSSALWSVGRSINMKRIDRLNTNGPEKPPQRIVRGQEEEEEEEEDDEQEQGQLQIETAVQPETRSRWRDTTNLHLEIQEEDEDLHQALESRAEVDARSSTSGRSTRDLHHTGSDGSYRRSPLQVPLGADEDEEEDDFLQDNQRFNRIEQNYGNARRSQIGKEVESANQRGAMQNILAAKIPQVVNKRAMAEGSLGLVSRDIPIAAFSNEKEVRTDFMGQVQQEAVRQRGQEHLEKIGSKPSKDLETKFNGFKFKKIRKAGEGGFSTVWQVRGPFAAPDPLRPGQYIDIPESDQAYFAMKQVTLKKMEKISREEVLEECNLLQSLAGKRNNEDYILRFFGWKSSTGSLKILLELGEHDFNHILREGRLSRKQIEQYWHQMLEAVHFTHEEGGIVHTDLKPANFLMANGRLKLIDFGIAQKIPVGTIHIKRDAMIGTPNYMAPETVRAVKEASKTKEGPPLRTNARVYKAGKASDVWALGCIFYQMVYDRPPFEAFHGDDKLKAILDPKHIIDYPNYRPAPYQSQSEGQDEDNYDENNEGNEDKQQREMEKVDDIMINVMQQTFIYDPQERVTIPRLLDHPFIRPNVSINTKSSTYRNQRDDQQIIISRETLKKMVEKLYEFTLNGELHAGNLDERGDALFDNIRTNQALSR